MCDSTHPDHSDVGCVLGEPVDHDFHLGTIGFDQVEWTNSEYVVPMASPSMATSRSGMVVALRAMAKRVEPEARTTDSIRAGQEAQMRVDASADPLWRQQAREVVEQVARRQATLIVDDLWSFGLDTPKEARAIGPVLTWAARQGFIESTGDFVPTAQIQCHGNPRRIWRSKVYVGPDLSPPL